MSDTAEQSGTMLAFGDDANWTKGSVTFCTPHVVTLPDGSKVAIPAGSTAVEVVEVNADPMPPPSFAGIAFPARGILSTVEGATREPQGLTAEAVWPLPGVRHPVEDDGA